MNRRPASTLLASALAACLALSGCDKIDLTPSLPEETTEGKGTFGCNVNGMLWLPFTDHTLDRAIEPEYQNGWFAVGAERETTPGQYIWLQLADSAGLEEKTYDGNSGFYAYYQTVKDGQIENYAVKPGGTASIRLTKIVPPASPDGFAIVSGTFTFTGFSASGDSIRITDGRFDVKAL